jgi:2'-5' RNA ligase
MPERVFVAIELPVPVRGLLAEAAAALLRADRAWAGEKPVSPGLMHVTLAFLGFVDDPALPGVVERLRSAASLVGPFGLRVSDITAVPAAGKATMLWAVLADPSGSAARLSSDLARAAGLPATERPFRAHVTLARARRPRSVACEAIAAANAVLSDPGKDADRFVSVRWATVFSSTLTRSGPTYDPLALLEFPAGADPVGPVDIEHVFV